MESADALMEEKKLMSEAKYRNYTTNIDKALRNFEYSSEWADLISALGKLSKAISSNTQYQVIPRRIKISKRLAQCMHPALPSGVHLKALETYAVIFSKTGPERLATELFIYSAGLFPLLGYAAMNVRPALLGIYETYFVPLGEKLRPALSGFLSGVLPGYECGLDHFERTNSLLTQVCAAVNPTHFYTVLWECMATNASIRLPAITYLLEHFNKRLTMQQQVFIMGHNRDIMMSGLCACLNDTVILVQRNTLEFLLLGFPMHTVYLSAGDLIKLVTNGLNTILRRDMSLNRRLYSWLLGSEVAKQSPTSYDAGGGGVGSEDGFGTVGEESLRESYFGQHSKHIVIEALICTLKFSLESQPVDLKPYRIMMSLLDKAEIGSAVLDFVLCDIIRTMSLSSGGNVEVVKSANVLFASFHPAYIWSFMTTNYEKTCKKKTHSNAVNVSSSAGRLSYSVSKNSVDGRYQCHVGCGEPCLVEICYLTEFLLETISLETYNETTRIFLPKVFLAITQMLTVHLEKISSEEITASLKLCMKIVSRVQPMISSPAKLMPRRTNHGYASSDEKTAKNATVAQVAAAGNVNALEKSKSDSKLNHVGNSSSSAAFDKTAIAAKDALIDIMGRDDVGPIRRSNSNQQIERNKSPKKKKAKSYSKLSELDKEICPETGQLIDPQQSSSDLDTPHSIKKLKAKAAKTPYMRIRTSPKKTITISPTLNAASGPKSLDPVMLKRTNATAAAADETDEQPKSAPPEQLVQGDRNVFDYSQDVDTNGGSIDAATDAEFSILEKCIRQYEVFFEVYLADKVLHVKRQSQPPTDDPVEKCRINVEVEADRKSEPVQLQANESQLNVENAFDNEEVYEDVSAERLHEVDSLFETLLVNVVSRSKQLHSLLNRSLACSGEGVWPGADVNDFSDIEYRDCVSSTEHLERQQKHTAHATNGTELNGQKAKATEQRIQSLIDLRLSSSLRCSIKLAANLLVEMSTFPNCNRNIILDKTEKEIPNWLKVLCLVAAYTQSDKELQLAAITTLFDLISLLKSQIEHTTSPGVTFVVMLPLLRFGHVSFIERQTRVFHLITSVLWNYLGQTDVDPAQITALLYQQHNCLESGLVETIIGNRMYAHTMHQQFAAADALAASASNSHKYDKIGDYNDQSDGDQDPTDIVSISAVQPELLHQHQQQKRPLASALGRYRHDRAADIELICVSPAHPVPRTLIAQLRESEARSFKKFELLWHLGRDKQPAKGFEKTLLKVLDTLALPCYMSVRTGVTKWLQSALLRGDLSRLVKPLYKILLTPNTHRIGIMHLHLLHTSNGQEMGAVAELAAGEEDTTEGGAASERDIYAISSEYGNIKYHHHQLNAPSGKKRSPIRTFHKKIFGVTLSSKNKTSNFVSDKAMMPPTPPPPTPPPPSMMASAMQEVASASEALAALDAAIGLTVNPLDDNSPDFDEEEEDLEEEVVVVVGAEQRAGNEASEPSAAAQYDAAAAALDDEDEYDEEDEADEEQDYTDGSDSSIFVDSDSENRETSVEKDESLTISSSAGGPGGGVMVGGAGSLKRFVGDCERVTELLSQHERTKNRKTYRLTREKTPGDSSLASMADDQSHSSIGTVAASASLIGVAAAGEEDTAHPADEYFSEASASTAAANATISEAVNELLMEVTARATGTANTPPADLLQNKKNFAQLQKKRKPRRMMQSAALDAAAKMQQRGKHLEKGGKKRMSCISKTSTDSNNSYVHGQSDDECEDDEGDSVAAVEGVGDEPYDTQSLNTNATTASTNTLSVATINVEEKRRNLTLETSAAMTVTAAPPRKAHSATRSEWGELTQETLEKGKQNVQILRENAAAAAAAATALGSGGGSKRSSTKSGNSSSGGGGTGDSHKLQVERLHFFHNHMLIYTSVYDTQQTLYAFQTLRNIIACDTRTFLCLSITTSLASGGALKQLLARHRKSIAGKGFAGNITNSEFAQSYRGCMHLEVLVTVCLFYARGFFHHDATQLEAAPTPHDILGNCRVQLESVELLTLICGELIDIVKGMGKGLAFYIGDLMGRCKLQKVILHCLNSAVSAFGQRFDGDTLAEQVLNFNDPRDEQLCAESFQVQLLRLLMAVIKLEHEVISLKSDAGHTAAASSSADAGLSAGGNVSPTRLVHIGTTADAPSGSGQASANVKYLPNCLISQQPMFLAAVLSALQDDRLRHLHRNWTDVVTASLNCFGSLTNIVISVVHQLCNNIDRIARLPLAEQCGFPPDYVVSQLEAITILCHYCLLDSTQQTTLSHLFNQAYPQTSVVVSQNSNNNTGQLLNSIVHTFLSSAAAASAASQSETAAPRNPQLLAARNAVLSHLSRIVASVAAVWDSELGQVRQVKQQLMEFLSPVSLHHGANFLAAVAVTWQERGEQHRKRQRQLVATGGAPQSLTVAEQYQRNSMPQACAEQLSLVTLVSSIRVMPMDSFVQTLHQVVKSPPPIHRPPAHLTIEVSALELFYFYMKSAPAPQLGDSWSSLLALLRDGLGLSPPAQFALLMLLNEFVQRCPQMPFQDKKDIRDLHDVTSRLIDSLSTVAGSCLEQTTWLRRNLAVKEDISGGSALSGGSGAASGIGGNGARESAGGGGLVGQQQQYAVQAQSVLAAILANLLDVAYGSQEKDKVVTIITTLLYNITPYLKNHTTRNVPSFYACSSLLASLSGYQYTRKAWRKDMLDLLLDNAFFQMDIACLPFWKQIMDSLMTYDNTTFRELMSRVSLTQTGSLNIFTSREQEYEQRSLMLKRLAFVIFCSEFDQYHKYMPEIQEQLANSLRLLSVVPSVQAAVFLCFRVLLLRMSPDHVTSLWPIIIAEMVQVFLAMEQELKSDSEDLSQQIRLLAGMDSSWSSSSSSGNGLNSQNHVMHWRSVQLEAAKMLELGCVLPATNLPHFQMYRWAFVGTEFDAHEEIVPVPINGRMDNDDYNVGLSDGDITATAMLPSTLYVPHIRRIARLMDMKYAVHSPLTSTNSKRGQHLVLTCQQISSLQDLSGFFSTLSVVCPNPRNFADTDKEVAACLAEIEELLARDFLERMPPSSSTTPR